MSAYVFAAVIACLALVGIWRYVARTVRGAWSAL